MYYEMVKSEILVLTRKKKLYVVDANVVTDWMLWLMQTDAGALLIERKLMWRDQ
jgi:hypothetical protein